MPRREIAPGNSCVECRRRKIKCDRQRPCSYCVKVRINCKYPASRRDNLNKETRDDVAVLESKVLALEKRLAEFEGHVSGKDRTSSTLTARNRGDTAVQTRLFSQASGRNTLDGHSTSRTGPMTLVKAQAPIDMDVYRPPPQTVAVLWQIYLDVVDPVFKIFHVPSVQKLVTKAIRQREKLDLASECLLFVIYYAAIAALIPSACMSELGEERSPLLRRYGLVITARNDPDGPDVYALTGLATGMALKMRLNQDPESEGYPPFECEMRRRLWWQLFTLDIRVAEDRCSEPCIVESSFNTRLPGNITDSNLHPAMRRRPVSEAGRTEMLYSLVRFEGSYFARQMVFSARFKESNGYTHLSQEESCQAIELFRDRIEKQYLDYCDEGIPIDRVTVQSMRLVLDKLKLTVLDQPGMREAISREERKQRRQYWMKILQGAEELRSDEAGAKWLWLFQVYIEWDALVYLLQHLRTDADGAGNCRWDDGAWELTSRVYFHWKGCETVQRDGRWREVEAQWSEADDYYERAGLILHGHNVLSCEWWYWVEEYGAPVAYEFKSTEQERDLCKLLNLTEVGVIKAAQYEKLAAIMARIDAREDPARQTEWALGTACDEGLLNREDVARAFLASGLAAYLG
ncbi:hypothetical protein BDW74DRAFT_187023 [Aspergillus multicolor]|uniref:transcription factor domain-containing protein n=1 Tax=Aspergillus multicolor TaxID=41759 RepID=UPI003CCD631E